MLGHTLLSAAHRKDYPGVMLYSSPQRISSGDDKKSPVSVHDSKLHAHDAYFSDCELHHCLQQRLQIHIQELTAVFSSKEVE